MPQVKVYSTPTCPYCRLAKDFLKENKIAYTEVDVSKDRKAALALIEKSGASGVPQIEVDGEIIVGYNKELLKKALKLR